MNKLKNKKLYDIIYADPPWQHQNTPPRGSPKNHYKLMKLKDIKELNIPSKKNSVLYLWIPAPLLLEGLEVLKDWGFKYITQMIWDKEIIGLGYWFRGQHEILLIGKKGKFSPPIPKLRISSVYKERRTKHSKKPDYIRDMILKWYPKKNKLELFARKKSKGWTCLGNEINKKDIREILKKL